MHRLPTAVGSPCSSNSSSRHPPLRQQHSSAVFASHKLRHHINQPAFGPAVCAAGRRSEQQTGDPPRQRRARGTTGSSSSNRSTSSGSGSSYIQQASWQRSRRPPPRRQGSAPAGDDDEFDAPDPLDQEFLDPQQASKLRKLMKAKGREAVLDKQGYVKAPVLEEDGAEAADSSGRQRDTGSSSSSSRQRRTAPVSTGPGPGAHEAPSTASSSSADTSSSSSSSAGGGRPRLFDSSQLQAAAPGSAGTLPVLPIVRPGSSPATSKSSPERLTAATVAARSQAGAASDFYSSSSWRELGASQAVQDAMAAIGISRPSHVQAEAYKALSPKSGFKHVAVADQAGSGKTLAYLLPLLQQLKEREQQLGGPVTQPNSPSLIILTPTTELAQQVGRVVRALSAAGVRVRSAIMTGGQSEEDRRYKTFRTQSDLLSGGVDVCVATPGRLLGHFQRGSLTLSNTAALVLDEVDVLAGGEVDYTEHIAPLRAAAPPSMRCVLVSATLPQHTFDELQELFMGLGAAFGPGLHRTAQGVVEELIDCSGGDDISLETGTARKLEALATALDRVRSPRTVVFCNKIETCRVVENALRRQMSSHQVLVYHEAIRDDLRVAALNTWLSAPSPSEPPMVLVCTDRTSRGIDSMWCEHVVLFEFPRDPSEYVRRVGRTARGAGGKGVVSVLVLGKQVPLAKDILERNREGVPVHRVPRLWSDK